MRPYFFFVSTLTLKGALSRALKSQWPDAQIRIVRIRARTFTADVLLADGTCRRCLWTWRPTTTGGVRIGAQRAEVGGDA